MANAGTKSNPFYDGEQDVTYKSQPPTIKSLTRSGGTFTLNWSKGDTYGKKNYKRQLARFRYKVGDTWSKYKDVDPDVSATATSASVTYSLSGFYPYTNKKLVGVGGVVKGLESNYSIKSPAYTKTTKRKVGKKTVTESHYYYKKINVTHEWSDWASQAFSVKVPANPVINAPTPSRNNTSFGFSVDTSDTARPYVRLQCETALVKDFGSKSPASNTSWTALGNYTDASGTISISEGSTISGISGTTSYTRLIRTRAQGAAGDSAYSYGAYIYAFPYKIPASNIKATRSGVQVNVTWTPVKDSTHPVESYKVEYYIDKPQNGDMAIKTGAISWSDGGTVTSTSITFNVDHQLSADEALWVRVTQIHLDGWLVTPSDAKFVAFGGVSAVTATPSVSYDSETHQLTIECANPVDSAIVTSYIACDLYYYSGGWRKANTYNIPHGATSVTVDRNLTGYTSWKVICYAGIGGGYFGASKYLEFQPRATATNIHAYPPTSVRVTAVQGAAGYADVTWINTIPNSTKSRVAITEDWSVTSPSFVVDMEVGARATSARVSGLEYNTQYYAGVKSFRDSAESDWSQIYPFRIDASAAPVPVLTAKEAVVGKDHFINVTWDWGRWAQADSLELFWAENPSLLATEYSASSETIKKGAGAGVTTFPIMKDIERGKTYYIQARFLAGAAETNMSKMVSVELPVIPVAPTHITVVREAQDTDEEGKTTVRVSWDNHLWEDADTTYITWSDTQSSWDSNVAPQSYKLDGANGRNTTALIANLEMGKTWYFKVRLTYDGDKFSTSYNDVPFVPIDLVTDPVRPTALLSASLISENSKTDVSWNYSCEDGAVQAQAEIMVTDAEGDEVTTVGVSGTETSFALYPSVHGLVGNNTYNVKVRTISGNGRSSEWSEAVALAVVHKPIAAITDTSLVDGVLTELPLSVTVSGLEGSGTTTVYIERAQSCFEPTPNEDQRGGYEGELIALVTAQDTGSVSITAEDLRGILNDDALFRLVAIVSDELGASDPVTEDFTVSWSHQAIMPIATREVDDDERIVKLTVTEPDGAIEGDTVDIYRLSTDKPELIIKDAVFGETYVDPYPAYGETGGHRFVYKTLNGDITTADKKLAWMDLDGSCDADDPEAETDAVIPADRTSIDFGVNRIDLFYNLELSHSWEKDFAETKYLGGSVQGDWNPAVSRKASVGSVAVTIYDTAVIEQMRRLAVYPGICHVRTPDGSSFPADVQVSEDRSHSTAGKIVNFKLDITRVDAERLDGMTLAEWQSEEETEEVEG